MGRAIAFLVLMIISPAAYAVTHNVGGSGGWNTGFNYGNWATGQTFVTGDSLLFNYDFTHAVDEVSEADYRSCNTDNPITSDSNSPTTISLTSTGTRYFICPRSNHCSQGMRLAVTITAGSTTPGGSPPSTGGSSPSPPATGSPATPGRPATPSPSVANRNSLMAGLSLVLAAMVGLLG